MQELYLLGRERAVEKLDQLLDGRLKQLCIRTRYPKEVAGFVSACLSKRGELESGAGDRCSFVKDKATWELLCSAKSATDQILVADPELEIDAFFGELLPMARERGHAVLYSSPNPRPDTPEIVNLIEPKKHEVLDLLKKYDFSAAEAEQLAQQSNGNIYILVRLLTGTNDRPKWARGELGHQLRFLALLGGWSDISEKDRAAISKITGEEYDAWIQRVYPIVNESEPPVVLEGSKFRPVSRYESWQQLGHYLTDLDLRKYQASVIEILAELDPELELPDEERVMGILSFKSRRETVSKSLKKGLAETLALLGGQGGDLNVSAGLASDVACNVVHSLLQDSDWKRWASLDGMLPQLAEAAPSQFLNAVDAALLDVENDPFAKVFGACGELPFGKIYHTGLLRALEALAWNQDYLSRVSLILARLAIYELPQNLANAPAATLRSIFLTWMPQTLASIDARRAAVESVIGENLKVGWNLLMEILPDNHQIGSYNAKPAWRDWFPSDWREGATRSEMYKQIVNYTELAVSLAMKDIDKLTQLISKWDHLPREVFQRVLDYIESPQAMALSEEDKFKLWERLSNEIDRHRKFAESDWAMPEQELRRLDAAASAIKPHDPAIVYQHLFNAWDHDLFATNNYDKEREAVALRRDRAVEEVIEMHGIGRLLDMALVVNHPGELGSALGRIGDSAADDYLLPKYLLNEALSIDNFLRGFIWARYQCKSMRWVRSIMQPDWQSSHKSYFLSCLPFVAEVWRYAEEILESHVGEYWARIAPNPYQASADLAEAAEKSLKYHRPEIAIDCINAMSHLHMAVSTQMATESVKQLVSDASAIAKLNKHYLLNVIEALQKAPDVDPDEMTWIEFQCLKLLDRFSGGSPIFLERRIASDPKFFHDLIKMCFRSEEDRDKKIELDENQQLIAGQAYSLLHNWHRPPGTTAEDQIDGDLFVKWIQEAEDLCQLSGHWPIAQQMVGHCLVYPPAGLNGILQNALVARCLDDADHEHMRRGLTIELFNRRGVHGFTSGREEIKLAEDYREYANNYDLQGYTRIASSLRGLAEGYERDAIRESARDPYFDHADE